jgi:hypothetical protein
MLDGQKGKLKQKAIEVIVQYAKVLGAEELCQVTKAHIFCGAHHYLEALKSEDIDEVISEMCFCSKEKVRIDHVSCYCQSDVGPMCPVNSAKMWVTEEERRKNEQYLQRYVEAGVNLVGTCIPYMVGFIPLRGEHYVTSESHAVLMLNSLWGACGHADGLEIGFCAAVCGRIPKWGYHIMENRKGTHVFHIRCKTETLHDWDLLGYTIGRFTPSHAVPVLADGFTRPDILHLKQCYASMATTGGAEMCHIVGITPEALTLEQALGGVTPIDEIMITEKDIKESKEMICSQGEGLVDFISLGCPHYSIEELRLAAQFLEGKQIADHVHLQVWTAISIKAVADLSGYTKKIEDAGGVVLTSSCPLNTEKFPPDARAMVFDSAKQAHYLIPAVRSKVYYGSMFDCLQSAVTGKWEVR